MACGEALLVAILPRKQRIDGMPFGGISGDCGSVAHQPRFGLWRNAGCEGGLIVHRPPSIDKVQQIAEQMRSEEHTSELQSLMSISYAVFCLKKKKQEKK